MEERPHVFATLDHWVESCVPCHRSAEQGRAVLQNTLITWQSNSVNIH